MAPWLAAALRLLFGSRLSSAFTGAAVGGGAQAVLGGDLGIPGVDLFPDKKRRRRRRRSLTASDRADIGFITGLLGQAAGKSFALTIASKTL